MSWSRIFLVTAGVGLWFLGLFAPSLAPRERPQYRLPDERPLPAGAVARLGSLRLRHEKDLRAIVYSPDGTKIAALDYDETAIRVWDVATAGLLGEIALPDILSEEFILSVEFSHWRGFPFDFTPDGNSIAAGVGPDVCFWDWRTGREVCRFPGKGRGVESLTFSSDGKTFYCGGSDGKLYQWDIATRKLLRSWNYFEGNQPRVFASGKPEKTAFLKGISTDGTTAAWLVEEWADDEDDVSKNGQVSIWDATTGMDRAQLEAMEAKDFLRTKLVISPNGKYLAAAGYPMAVWDAATGKKLKTLECDPCDAVAFSPDSRQAALLTRDGLSLCTWATEQKLCLAKFPSFEWRIWSHTVAFAPDGRTVAFTHGKQIRIWNAHSATETAVLEGHRWPVRALAFAPQGSLISSDGVCLCEWDIQARQSERYSFPEPGRSHCIAESCEAGLRICGSYRPQLRDLITNKVLAELNEVTWGSSHGCFSADGRTVAILRSDNSKREIIFLDVRSRKVRSRFTTDEPIWNGITLSGNGRVLAVPCRDQTVLLIDSHTGYMVQRLGVPSKIDKPFISLTKGAFSPDGLLLAYGALVQKERPSTEIKRNPQDTPRIRVWECGNRTGAAAVRELPRKRSPRRNRKYVFLARQ